MSLSSILYPIEWVIAWIMVGFHNLLTFIGMPAVSGWTWALSIVGLVLVIRSLLIPLFVKQIRSSRKMQLIQPEVQRIQAKYKGKTDQVSRQQMLEETMAVYKREGTTPYSSCLPILLQMPIFFALFRTLNSLGSITAGTRGAIGPLDQQLAEQAYRSELMGASLSSTFLGSEGMAPKILTIVLIVLMSLTTFYSQRQLTMKNMPESALTGQFATTQKIMLYAMPLIFAISGINFPVGVLIYWFVSNLWSMVQQFYVIRRMPTVGSPAYDAWVARQKAKGKTVVVERGTAKVITEAEAKAAAEATAAVEPPKPAGQRVQPKRKKKKR